MSAGPDFRILCAGWPIRPPLAKRGFMRPLKRSGVNKKRSAGKFRKHSRRTNARNVKGPMRGGIRL